MARIAVPFHLDERRAAMTLPFEPDLVVDRPAPTAPTWRDLAPLYTEVAAAVAGAADGEPVLVFAADCCAAVGVLAGLVRRGLEPGVVWIDAHGDFNTPATTVSGYLGGMVLSFITGRGDGDGVGAGLGLAAAGVADDRVLLVDGRDLDPAEKELLESSGVRRTTIDRIDVGLHSLATSGPLLLHVDLDVIDPSALPGLLFPAPGGAAVSNLLDAVAAVVATGRVVATSVGCTWHPDESDVTICHDVVAALVGVVDPVAGE